MLISGLLWVKECATFLRYFMNEEGKKIWDSNWSKSGEKCRQACMFLPFISQLIWLFS